MQPTIAMLSEACSKSTSRDLLFTMAILFPAIIEKLSAN